MHRGFENTDHNEWAPYDKQNASCNCMQLPTTCTLSNQTSAKHVTHVPFSVISYSLHLIANKLPAGTYITYGMLYCSFDMFDSKKIGPPKFPQLTHTKIRFHRPFPTKHLSEATAGFASTAHPADAVHAPRCTSRSGALSWNRRSNGSRALQTPGCEELTWEVR